MVVGGGVVVLVVVETAGVVGMLVLAVVLGRRLKTAATEESSVKTDNRINITAF
jgi:hypothetical protein